MSSIIETPPEIIKQLEKMIYKFLWKGPDKVTRLSVINTLENDGLNLTDLELHIKALRVSAYKNRPKPPINGTSQKIDFACILPIDRS